MRIDYNKLLLELGEEMYNAPAFIRNFHVWKLSHLATRIVPITDKFQLPWNSVLHVLDNIQYPPTEIQDAPRLETNPFIQHETYRKWIYHDTQFHFSTKDQSLPIDIDYNSGMLSTEPTQRKYIFKTAKLQQNLLAFRTQQKNNFRYLTDLTQLPTMKNTLIVINHNPLFRVFTLGKLRFFRRFQFILGSILNTVCMIPQTKTQYIHIPLTTTVFLKETFRRTFHDLSLVTLKYPNNYHYLVMMHLLNFLNPDADTSLFSRIPEDFLRSIVLILTVGNNALFYPLYDLKILNEKNRAYLRIVNQLNMLAMSHTAEVQKVMDALPDEDVHPDISAQLDTGDKVSVVKKVLDDTKKRIQAIREHTVDTDTEDTLLTALNNRPTIEDEKQILIENHSSDKQDEYFDELDEELDPLSLEESDEYDSDTTPTDSTAEAASEEEESADMQDDSGSIEDDELAQDTQDLLEAIVEQDKAYQKAKQTKQVTMGVIQAKQNVDRTISKESTDIDTADISTAVIEDINHVVTNSPCVKVFNEDKALSKARAEIYLQEMDIAAAQLIDSLEHLTPAQKQRYLRLATAYKHIPVGNTTIGNILNAPTNASLKDIELDFLKDQIPDQSMLKSSILTLDDSYMQNTFARDLLATATAFTKNGVFLVDMKVEPITTELNKLVKYTFYYEDVNGKSSTIQITLPQVNKHGHMFVNGTKKILKKQMVNLPIVKVSNTRVSLSSAMNKTIIERNVNKAYSFTAYIATLLRKLNEQDGISVSYISSVIKINIPLAYEYTALAKVYRTIEILAKSRKLICYFDYHQRLDYFAGTNKALREKITNFEKKYKAVVFCKDTNTYGCIDINNTVYFMDNTGVVVNQKKTTIIELLNSLSPRKLGMKSLAEWTTLKIRDKNLPIIFILAYQYGLVQTLNYIKCHWTRISKTDRKVIEDHNPIKVAPPLPGMKLANETPTLSPGEKYLIKQNDILIPFKDEYIVINRYPLIQSLIAAGLLAFDTSNFTFADMEDVSTYFTLLEIKGYSTNYLKAITGFFGYFIDPMTRDKLELMKEPTNARDLLIRGTQLLATEDYRQPSSMANHCIRSYERFNVIIFNEMARALETYQISGGAGSKFTINPNAVYQRIITDQAIAGIEEINPTMDVKEKTTLTYTGVGGRTAQSFVIVDRQFPDDGTGIISENTADSSKVSIVAQAAVDATIMNNRGMIEKQETKDLEPTQVLSVASLLMPGLTNDDGKRISFCLHQLTHHIPTIDGDVCRVRTGYERVIAHRTSGSFASAARFDGIVEEVNTKLKMIKVRYDNGETDVVSFADLYTGASGLVIEQEIALAVKEGQTVHRGDILVYNKHFFKADPYSTQVDWKHGVMANVVLAERSTTLEDSNGISVRLGEKFGISPIEVVRVAVDNDTIVHEILPVGSEVRKGDLLITYEDGELGESLSLQNKDPETLALIQEMSRQKTKSPIQGTIVKIDAYYGCPIPEMHPTLAAIVNAIAKYKNARNQYCAGTDTEYDNPKSGPLPKGEKYRGIDMNEHTVVLSFYIRHRLGAGVGDKIVYDSSLKSVISSTFPEPMTTQSGVEVDAVFSGTGILHRVINSPLLVGSLQRVLEKTEKNMIEWWNKKKVV